MLTFSTGMTMNNNANAESATNWAIARIAGSGGAPSSSLSTDVFKEGAASMSAKVSVANTDAVLIYDYYTDHSNTALDLSTGNQHVALWGLLTTITAVRTQANGGMYILLQSSAETGTTAPTVYSKWYIGGSDAYGGGWVRFIIDPTKTASTTAGGGVNLAAVRRIGLGVFTEASVPTIKAENLFIDAIAWGKPVYKVVGDGALTATWNDFISNSNTNANGLIQNLGGAYALSCGIRFGDSAQGATTTFRDETGKTFIFKRHTYYQGASVQDVVDYANVYVVDAQGAALQRTSVTLGSVVGTGNDRQGVLGGSIFSADTTNITWKADFQTDKADLSAVKLYGLNVTGAKGGVLLDNNSGATETSLVSCSFVNCGEVVPGTTGNGAEILSSTIIDPLGATNNRGLRIPSTNNIKRINFITSGTPTTQHLVHLNTAGTYTVNFDAMKFFGNYASATLWHGENSANNTNTVTVSATNQANPSATEFNNTGIPAGTIVVSNDVNLTITVEDSSGNAIELAQTAIYKTSDNTELMNKDTNASGVATATFNYVADTDIYIRIRKSSTGSTRYLPFSTTGTIPAGGFTLAVTLAEDTNA